MMLRRSATSFGLALLAVLALGDVARGAAPAGQYTISSGTVQDRRTGLVWQRSPDSLKRTAANAAAYCANLEAGASWRLPTVQELLTLVDVTATSAPTIDQTAFPGTGSQLYWTSTTYADPQASAAKWVVDFNTGVPSATSSASTTLLQVRCVR